MSGSLVMNLNIARENPQSVTPVFLSSEQVVLDSAANTSSWSVTLPQAITCGDNEKIYVGVADASFISSIYTIIEGGNDSLPYSYDIGGVVTGTATLAPGYYNDAELAAEIQRALRVVPALSTAGITCTVNNTLNKFVLGATLAATQDIVLGGGAGVNTNALYPMIGLVRQLNDNFPPAGTVTLTGSGGGSAVTANFPEQINLQYERLSVYFRMEFVSAMEAQNGTCINSTLFDKIPLTQAPSKTYVYSTVMNPVPVNSKSVNTIVGRFTNKRGIPWQTNFPWSISLLFMICEQK